MRKFYVLLIFCLFILSVFTSCDDKTLGTELVTITLHSGFSSEKAEIIETVKDKSIILPSGDSLWTTDSYSFTGWSLSKGGDVKYKAGDKYSSSSDVTLYAIWEADSTITYNSNGGTGGEVVEHYKKGNKVTLKNTSFTKEGYTLSYWSTSPEASDTYTIGQEITLTENLTLYAVWVENKDAVSIIFSSGKVTENEQSMSSTEGQEIILPSGDSFWSSNEYSFTGWAVSENGDVQYKAGDKYKVGKCGATLYAVWEDNLTITYKANSGTGSDVIEYYKSGSKVIVKDASFTKEDYSFSYWSTTESGTDGTSYTLGEEITITTNMTLYAIWVETKDAVKLIFNPGTVVTGNEIEMNLIEGQTTFLPSGSRFWEADNYTFKGWEDQRGWGVRYSAGDLYYAEKNTTLYAVWEKNKVTVTYSANGGSGSVDPVTVEVGETVTVDGTSSSLSREGYTFLGWGTSPDGTGTVISGTVTMPVNSNLTFYAIWKENRNIKYYNGDKLIRIEYPSTDSVAIGDGNGLSKDGHALYWTTSSDGTRTSYDVGEVYTETASLVLYAQWQEDNGSLTYTLDTTAKTYSVKASNTGISGEIEIPEIYKGKKVTAIEELGFENCGNITKITIPSSVTSIGGGAFYSCTSLQEITLPEGITELKLCESNIESYRKGLFGYCSKLTEIKIPSSVTSIGDMAFEECSSLASVEIEGNVASIGSSAFSKCYKLESFTIPESVVSIGQNAFSDSGIKEIVVPAGVTEIGARTFSSCSGLTKITIPDTVTKIGDYAFEYCYNLETINIPASVTSIGSFAFNGCGKLTEVTIPFSVTAIGSYAFSNCSSLTALTIENTALTSDVSWDAGNATYTCGNFVLDKNGVLTRTDSAVFSGNVEIPSKIGDRAVTKIGSSAFENCTGLTQIEISESVTTIDAGAFKDCSGLISVVIPGSITSIASDAFSGCTNLKSIYIDKEECSTLDTSSNKWGAPEGCTVTWKKAFTAAGETINIGSSNGTPITWKALSVDSTNKCALLVSQDILEVRDFDSRSASYKSSAIRTYLNNTTDNSGFFPAYGLSTYYMKKVDVTSSIETTTVSDDGTDYIFLLSKTEASTYFSNNSARIANDTSGTASLWWLRSPVEYTNLIYCVKTTGEIYGDYSFGEYGVRPAFWYTWN